MIPSATNGRTSPCADRTRNTAQNDAVGAAAVLNAESKAPTSKKRGLLSMSGSQTVIKDRIAGHDVYRHSLLNTEGRMRRDSEEVYTQIMTEFWSQLIR